MTFRYRIMSAILVVTVLGLSTFYFFTYYVATDLVETNYAKSITNKMDLRMSQIDENMRGAYQKAVALSIQPELHSIINEYVDKPQKNVEDTLKVSTFLREQNDTPDSIDAIFLYLTQTNQIIGSQEYREVMENVNSKRYKWILGEGTGVCPLVSNNMSLEGTSMSYLYAKPIYSDKGERIGTIGVSISERSLFYRLLDTGKSTEETFLLDEKGYICSARQSLKLGNHISQTIEIPWEKEKTEVGKCRYNEKTGIYATVKSAFSKYTLISVSDHELLIEDLKQTQWLFTVTLLLVIIVAVFIANRISNMLNKPLKNLMYAMERVGRGEFETRAKENQKNEFYQINTQFNDMVTQIDELISQVVDEQKNARQSELRALQYQIKPHFMYNTLNSIKYMAIMQGNEHVGKQLEVFIELLEASLNRESDFSTLGFELQLVRDYVALQNYRYMGCFEMIYEVTEVAGKCLVPRFLLQPLVENSILHGMDTKRNDNQILIRADVKEDMLHIEVADNGKGMTREQMQAVLHEGGDTTRQFNGIGVFNTKERLRLFFGDRMKFELQSNINQGTRYVIEFPTTFGVKELR